MVHPRHIHAPALPPSIAPGYRSGDAGNERQRRHSAQANIADSAMASCNPLEAVGAIIVVALPPDALLMRPSGARSSHWYMFQIWSSPRA